MIKTKECYCPHCGKIIGVRSQIIELIKEKPRTINDLQILINIDRTSIYHHLLVLEKMNQIQRKKYHHRQGKPVFISLK